MVDLAEISAKISVELRMFAVIAERMPRGNSTEPPRRRTHLRSSRRSRFRYITNRLPQKEPCVTFEPATNTTPCVSNCFFDLVKANIVCSPSLSHLLLLTNPVYTVAVEPAARRYMHKHRS